MLILGYVFFLFVFWFNPQQSFLNGKDSKTISVSQLQTSEGLPQNSIMCISQLSDGRLLIGTGNGLVIYNGIQTTIPKSPLNSGATRAFYKVDEFNYLVQQNNSLVSFNTQTLNFSLKIPAIYVLHIQQTDSLLSVISSRGITEYSRNGTENQIEVFTNFVLIQSIFLNDDPFFYSSDQFLIQFKNNKISFKQALTSIPVLAFNYFHQDSTNTAIITKTGDIFFIDNEKQTLTKRNSHFNSFTNNTVISAVQLSETSLLINFEKIGLYIWNFETDQFTSLTLIKQDNPTQSIKYISTLFVDRFGIIWVGTDGYGLYYFNQENQLFSNSKINYPDLHKKKALFVTSFYEDINLIRFGLARILML
jgi:ligand-binding sensor domain-containing protein